VTVKSINPREISDTLKEAVVDSLLNGLNGRVSGTGEFHRTILGVRPSRLLMSAFLVPRPPEERVADEESDPMQISAHGLDFQIDNASGGVYFDLQLRGAIYVRILPNEADVQVGGPLRPIFPLRSETKQVLRQRLNEELDNLRTRLGIRRGEERRHPDWAQSKAAIQQRINEIAGVIPQPRQQNEAEELEDVVESEEAAAASAENPLDPDATLVVPAAPPAPVRLRDDVYEEVNVPEKWLRLDVSFPAMRFSAVTAQADADEATRVVNAALAEQLDAWYQSDNQEVAGRLWGFRKHCKVLPSELSNWSEFLRRVRTSDVRPVYPSFDLRWSLSAATDPLRPERLTVHVAIENWTELPKAKADEKERECSLFQVSISVSIPKGVLRPLTLDRVKPSYRYNKYLQYPALGFNGGVILTKTAEADLLATTWAPRYVLPRTVPTDVPVERKFAELSKLSGLEGLTPLIKEYDQWLSETREIRLESGIQGPRAAEELQNERIKFDTDLQAWQSELESLKVGVALLKESASHWSGPGPQKDPRGIPCEAWLSMNAAMQRVGGSKYDSWRLFQLAFVLSMVPTFATRIPEFHGYYKDEIARQANAVTLLYFATGGGKSEAFLGLLLFVLFLDRLRGKTCGVSALMRYPLRLLTLQQARRTMLVLAAGEHERYVRGHPGEPFSLGFWVGGANTPNWHRADGVSSIPILSKAPLSEEERIKDVAPYSSYRKQWLKLEDCPFCRSSPMALRRLSADAGGTLGHFCTASKEVCEWNARFQEPTPLPFFIVDEDIYATAPSVLLGTVDKLAVIGQSFKTIRLVFGMFGFAPYRHLRTGRLHTPITSDEWNRLATSNYDPLFPSFAAGERFFFDPFPALLIQDEAHLLEESLGTFAGLFESALEAGLDELAVPLKGQVSREPHSEVRRRVKVIAASATVSEPTRQMRNLYQRDATQQFPHPGPDLYTSFYATPLLPADVPEHQSRLEHSDPEIRHHGARIYGAILTNGHRHTVAMASILGNYHFQITDLYEKFRSDDPALQIEAKQFLLRWITPGPLRELFCRSLTNASADELLSLVDLHRIALTYVTNKKGGDQVIDTERVQFETLHRRHNYPAHTLLTRLISGAVSASEIQAVVREAESRVPTGQEFPDLNTRLRSIIATSAVSHGVDVEEFNAMFFAGLPSDIAEYIQASSRVGRTHVGFSLLVPIPQRHRDRFVTEIFDIFHRFLERMVMPAAVDRWADKAIRRVIPSILQQYLCGVSRIQEFCAAPTSQKQAVKNFGKTNEVRDYLYIEDRRNAVTRFLIDAVGLNLRPPPDGEEYYRALLRSELNTYRKRMDDPQLLNTQFGRFFDQIDASMRPMTSLRDVDQPGLIHASNRDFRWARTKKDSTARVMEFIRRGVASELNDDGDSDDD
jgi:hypothetical protein